MCRCGELVGYFPDTTTSYIDTRQKVHGIVSVVLDGLVHVHRTYTAKESQEYAVLLTQWEKHSKDLRTVDRGETTAYMIASDRIRSHLEEARGVGSDHAD